MLLIRLVGAFPRQGGIFSRDNFTMEEMATLTIGDSQAERGGGIMTTKIRSKAGVTNL